MDVNKELEIFLTKEEVVNIVVNFLHDQRVDITADMEFDARFTYESTEFDGPASDERKITGLEVTFE